MFVFDFLLSVCLSVLFDPRGHGKGSHKTDLSELAATAAAAAATVADGEVRFKS